MFLCWKTQTVPMHASEILIMLHTLFLQQVSQGKGNVPSQSTYIVAFSFAILSVCEGKENAVATIAHAFGAFAGIVLLLLSLCPLFTVFTGTGKLFLMCVKVE